MDSPRRFRPENGVGPHSLGRYRLLRLLGKGGMSEVFLGYDAKAGRPVAVKAMSESLAEDPTQMERFRRETTLSQKLHHPNIVRGLDAGRDAATKRRYLVLEYVDGPSASTLLDRRTRLDVNDVVHIGMAVARALAHLHKLDFVHRDIKPDNILLSPCGRAKLIDLGLVRWREHGGEQLTAGTADGLGTSYYMPLEQGLNAHWVDARSDIFALGATLYHLVTGRVPFPGDDHREVMRMKDVGNYVPASLLNPRVPAELELILNQMLARDPRQRFQNCHDLLVALQRARLTKGLPSFADLGQSVQLSLEKEKTQPQPTRPDLRLRASQMRKSRSGDMWIVRYTESNGAWVIRKATTGQLLRAVRSGRFASGIFGARRPRQKFRPLGDFPEFHPYFVKGANPDTRPTKPGLCRRLWSKLGLGLFAVGALAAGATAAVAAGGHFLCS